MILVHADKSGKGIYRPHQSTTYPHLQQVGLTCGSAFMTTKSEDLNRTSLELRFHENFWNLYLPPTITATSCAASFVRPGIQWAEYTLKCVPRSDVTRCALLALSTSKLGRDNQDRLLAQRGMEMYGKALSLFAKELKTPGQAKPFEVLNCCRILALYEQINDISSAANNWKGHVQGLLNLVHLHPPEAFSPSGPHEIFLETRFDGVTSALSNRKATFLSCPEWMTGPWKNRRKDAVDTAMDVLVKLPGVLEEWDVLITHRYSAQILLHRVKVFQKCCLKIDHELHTWYNNFICLFEHEYPNVAEVLLQGMNNPAHQLEIPSILAKIGLHHLHAMTLYWTACTILHATIDLLHAAFPEAIEVSSYKPIATGTGILKYLICLAHSAKYFLRSDLGLIGTLSISHTGTCLVRTLYAHQSCYPNADPEDLERLKLAMGVMRELSGFDTWKTWKYGMDDLNYNKHEVLDRYDSDCIDRRIWALSQTSWQEHSSIHERSKIYISDAAGLIPREVQMAKPQ